MIGNAFLGGPLQRTPNKQRALDNEGRFRTKFNSGRVVNAALPGTSVTASYAIQSYRFNLPVTIPLYFPFADASGNFSSGYQGAQAKGGARLADGGVAGIAESQLNAILEKKHDWDVAIIGAPVNDSMTSLALVNSVLATQYQIGSKLTQAGIAVAFQQWSGTTTGSYEFKLLHNLGLYLMCEKYGWSIIPDGYANIDPVDGEEKTLYTVDTVHWNTEGALRSAKEINRWIRGERVHSHVLLPTARRAMRSVSNFAWANWSDGSTVNDASGNPTLSGFGTFISGGGGTITARSATTAESAYVQGHVVEIARAADAGSCVLQCRSNVSGTQGALELNDEIIWAWRQGGTFVGTTSSPSIYYEAFNGPSQFLEWNQSGRGGWFSQDFATGWRLDKTSIMQTGQRLGLNIALDTKGGSFSSAPKLWIAQVGMWNITAAIRAGLVVP